MIQFSQKTTSWISIQTRINIGPRAIICGHINFKGGNIKYKGIKVGNGCFLGNNSVLTPGCEVGDRPIIGAFTVALLDTIVLPDQTWIGMPAKPLNDYDSVNKLK